MKPKRSNSKRVPNRARSAGSHERLVMRRRNIITKIIQSEVGYFNGWAVTAEAEWGACAKAAEKIMRVMSCWKPHNAADQRRLHMSDSNSRKTRGRRSTASAGSPHRGTRCGVCYWALYVGDWCQNPKCVMSGKSVGENRIYLTNDEAQTLIAANADIRQAGPDASK